MSRTFLPLGLGKGRSTLQPLVRHLYLAVILYTIRLAPTLGVLVVEGGNIHILQGIPYIEWIELLRYLLIVAFAILIILMPGHHDPSVRLLLFGFLAGLNHHKTASFNCVKHCL